MAMQSRIDIMSYVAVVLVMVLTGFFLYGEICPTSYSYYKKEAHKELSEHKTEMVNDSKK